MNVLFLSPEIEGQTVSAMCAITPERAQELGNELEAKLLALQEHGNPRYNEVAEALFNICDDLQELAFVFILYIQYTEVTIAGRTTETLKKEFTRAQDELKKKKKGNIIGINGKPLYKDK